jgi:hypothetical protein
MTRDDEADALLAAFQAFGALPTNGRVALMAAMAQTCEVEPMRMVEELLFAALTLAQRKLSAIERAVVWQHASKRLDPAAFVLVPTPQLAEGARRCH